MNEPANDPYEDASIAAGQTRWSLILAAAGDGEDAERALEELLRLYWRPLYVYARRQLENAAEAEDVVQSFLVRKLVAGSLVRSADRAAGSFRGLLKKAMDQWILDVRRQGRAEKRGGGAEVVPLAEGEEYYREMKAADLSPDAAYDVAWASELLHYAMEKLEARAATEEDRLLLLLLRSATLPAAEGVTREEVARRLGMTGNAVSQRLHRLRQEELLGAMRAELRGLCRSEREFQEEWGCLLALLGFSPGEEP